MDLGLGYSLLMAVKVVILFILIYIYIPAQIIRFDREDTFLDKVFISLIYSNLITIIIVHFLAFLKLYEFFSLVFCYFAVYLAYSFIRGKSPFALADALGMKFVANLLDLSEGRLGLRGELRKYFKNWFCQIKAGTFSLIRNAFTNPFGGVFTVAVMAAAAYIRFRHSIIHAYFGASDPYFHLAWVKYLGLNEIYKDGVYPHGFEAIITSLSKIVFLDPYFIVRFIGPLTGLLIILSIYFITLKSFKNAHAALISIFIYGLITDSRFPSYVWRQISALPMEYATIFLLPGIYFFNSYFKDKNLKFLLLASECLALTILIHPYVTYFLIVGYFIIIIINFNRLLDRSLLRTVSFLAASVVMGITPMAIGLMTGKKFHDALGYVKESAKAPANNMFIDKLIISFSESNPFLLILLICIAVIIAGYIAAFLLEKKKLYSQEHFMIALITLMFYIMYRAEKFNLPEIMDPVRIGIYLSIMAAVTYGSALNIFNIFLNKERYLFLLKSAVCLGVFLVVFGFTNTVAAPDGDCLEYDETVNNYLKIKNKYPPLNWTIVSPVEQHSQSISYGWHYELWEFVDSFYNGSKELKFTTEYIFLFTEKIPLGSNRKISADDVKKLPELSGNAFEHYYLNVENRIILEANAFFWAENYIKKHNNVEIFYDGNYVRVYLIKQDINNPINLLS
ncbi:MAG TPA: hypothetical protein PK728_03920 [Bacillota bacterium]|nr:hypothetical protein [Bacillota bacterium]